MRKREGPGLVWGRAGSGRRIFVIFALCAGVLLLGGCPLASGPEDPGTDPDTEVPNPSDQTEEPEEQSGPLTPDDPGGSDDRSDPGDSKEAGNPDDPAEPETPEESEDSGEDESGEDSEESADPADPADPKDPKDPEESEASEESEDSEEDEAEEEPEDSGEPEEEPAELVLRFKKPADRGLSIEGLPEGILRLSQTGKDDRPRELRLRITDYTKSACWVDGREILPQDGEYVISALNYGISRHVVTCMGVVDGIPYGREIQFIITE